MMNSQTAEIESRPATAAAFWNRPLAGALAEAGATIDGLASAEADLRLRQHGPNDAADMRRSPAWLRFAGRFRNPLILILLVASGLSAAAGDLASFVIVVTIVVLSVLLDFIQETRAQNAVDVLQRTVALRAAANGRYVTAEHAGTQPLIANRTTIGAWEKFTLVTM